MVLAIPKGRQTHLVILAISGTPPRSDQTALEIPQLECRRAEIQGLEDAWIAVSGSITISLKHRSISIPTSR